MISVANLFKQNINFVKYGRSGSVVYSQNDRVVKELFNSGWKKYSYGTMTRLNPPTVTMVDIIDIEKANQYKNITFNFALFDYLNDLNKKNYLNNYINEIIIKNKILFKNFEYHVSVSPILQFSIKIEGSDQRIHVLKQYLLKQILTDREFKNKFKKYDSYFDCKVLGEIDYIDNFNYQIINYYKTNFGVNEDQSIPKLYKIDTSQINFDKYDKIIFILNGCFKILPFFDLKTLYQKMIFWEIHIDKTKGENRFIDLDEVRNKKILIIDSLYSGKTILYIKNILNGIVLQTDVLGVFPKSDNVIKFCNYILVLNKVMLSKNVSKGLEYETLKIMESYNEKERISG